MRKIIIGQDRLNRPLEEQESLWIYNGLDCTITCEVAEGLRPQIKQYGLETPYKFVLAQREPLIDIMLRGIKVDSVVRDEIYKYYQKEHERVYGHLQAFAEAVWGKGLNPNSSPQCIDFFYNAMGLPEQKKWDSKERKMKVTVNRDALEKLRWHFYAMPIINTVLALREIGKRMSFLRAKLSKDNRFHFTLTPGGAETGRLTSSKSAYGLGSNSQNVENEHDPSRSHLALRRIFIPDEGMMMGQADLAQAESNVVSCLAHDEAYHEAHMKGDPHTLVASMVWDLPMTKEAVSQVFYRTFTYRDMAKRGQHLSNYKGGPKQMADSLKIELNVANAFQGMYFRRFPSIPAWWLKVQNKLQRDGYIINSFGRKRFFLKRRDADETLKEAIAHEPQSTISDLLKMGLIRVYNEIKSGNLPIQLLNEGHDSILYQFPEEKWEEVSKRMIELMYIPFNSDGWLCQVGVDVEVGYDWHNLVDWKKGGTLKRPEKSGILDRLVSSVH